MIKGICIGAAVIALFCGQALAGEPEMPASRPGFGQDAPKEPVQIRNLRLDNPLVQQKFMQDNDLLRFLRGAYSESCVRGIFAKALTQVRMESKFKAPSEAAPVGAAVAELLDNGRIWKLTSFEMEIAFGRPYLKIANYCDCAIKEITPNDLVNPMKSIDVIDKLPSSTKATCERLAEEKLVEKERKAAKKQ